MTATITLPEIVTFEELPYYASLIKNISYDSKLTIDLSKTKSLHSSFIGLLIDIKNNIIKHGGQLFILVSAEIDKILSLLQLNNFFS